MGLTKKDYVAVAKIIKGANNKEDLTQGLTAYFKGTNSLFDEERFLIACGVR